ncbi:MAG: urease accessory protein UreF [Burkholderiales bacterium]
MTTTTTELPAAASQSAAAEHPTHSAPLSAHALLHLMWLASPALPVGGFSYSEGLEAAVDSGSVSSESQANRWLQDQLQLSLARCELAVVAQAFDAWRDGDLERVQALNHWVLATRESSELRQQTQQMGRSLAEWLKNQTLTTEDDKGPLKSIAGPLPRLTWPPRGADPCISGSGGPHDSRVQQLASLPPSPTWPVAFALAAQQTAAPVRETLLSLAFGWAENMVQAALKAVPLGQSAGQRVLAALCAQIPAAVEQALNLHDDERQAHSPMLAILSAQHETQYSRLFRS